MCSYIAYSPIYWIHFLISYQIFCVSVLTFLPHPVFFFSPLLHPFITLPLPCHISFPLFLLLILRVFIVSFFSASIAVTSFLLWFCHASPSLPLVKIKLYFFSPSIVPLLVTHQCQLILSLQIILDFISSLTGARTGGAANHAGGSQVLPKKRRPTGGNRR